MSKDGFDNEIALIEAINGKSYRSLNENLKKFIKAVFPYVSDNDVVHCQKHGGFDKADLSLTLNGVSRMVSIKKGSGNSVHQEPVENFIDYLKSEFGDNSEVFNALRHFIWGDGSLNGYGEKSSRISSRQYAMEYEKNTALIRDYFYQIKKPLLLRFVLYGDKSKRKPDFIYYGDLYNGYCASSEKIVEYLIDDKNQSNSLIPVGPLTFQAWNRALKPTSKSEKKRGVIQLKWPGIKKALEDIHNE